MVRRCFAFRYLICGLAAATIALGLRSAAYADTRTYVDGQGHTVNEYSHEDSYTDAEGHYVETGEQTRTYTDTKTGVSVKHTYVHVVTVYTKKGGKKLRTRSYVSSVDYGSESDLEKWDDTLTDNVTGESWNEHGDADLDDWGIYDGDRTLTYTVPGKKPEVKHEIWDDDIGRWMPSLNFRFFYFKQSGSNMDYTPVQPVAGGGSGTDQGVYFPPIAGPGSTIVFSVHSSINPGPDDVLIGSVYPTGEETFVKTFTNFAYQNKYKIAAGVVALAGFLEFDEHGKPDVGARCDIGTPPHLAGTQPLMRPPTGPGIIEGDSAYEQGGGGQGLIRLHTQGIDPEDTQVLLNGSAHHLKTLAVSDESYLGRVDSSVAPGQYSLTLVSDGKQLNGFKFDLVTLQADPLPESHPGSVNYITVHVSGIAPGDSAVMDFQVTGAAELAQGGTTTSVPVQNGIAQVQIRGIHDGQALVRYRLRVGIPGEWKI